MQHSLRMFFAMKIILQRRLVPTPAAKLKASLYLKSKVRSRRHSRQGDLFGRSLKL